MTPRYLTVAQTAKELQVCRETVYGWVRDGRIAVFRVGGLIRIPRSALEDRTCEANPSSSTSKEDASSTSSTRRQAAAGRRWKARVSKVVPITPRNGH